MPIRAGETGRCCSFPTQPELGWGPRGGGGRGSVQYPWGLLWCAGGVDDAGDLQRFLVYCERYHVFPTFENCVAVWGCVVQVPRSMGLKVLYTVTQPCINFH